MAQPETDRQPLRMYVVTAGHGCWKNQSPKSEPSGLFCERGLALDLLVL